MKRFKKIYVEITNTCNLSCDFCIKNKRKNEVMNKDKFIYLLDEIKPYTDYLYFHILGEPLFHPSINEFIDEAANSFKINITTNGYLIENIKNNKNIRQLNISLHSFDEKYNISLEKYLNNIFNTVDMLSKYTYINYRIWKKSRYTDKIISELSKHYKTDIKLDKTFTIKENIFISIENEFIWPDLNKEIVTDKGTCLGLQSHLGILVDGTVIPCCLDSKGDISLGNIFKENLDVILNKEKSISIIEGFRNNYKCEELCQKCQFREGRENL